MENKDTILTLKDLGLNSNQARVYLALLRSGLSSAKTISKNAKVARSDVYRVLKILEKFGLVEKMLSLPCKFRAISLQDALSILIEKRMNETTKLKTAAREALEKFKNEKAQSVAEEDEDQFCLLPEQLTVMKKKRSLKKVQSSLDVITSWNYSYNLIFIDVKDMIEALKRGVEIRIIVEQSEKGEVKLNALQKYPNFKIRFILKSPNALISVYDNKEAWIYTGKKPKLKEFPSLYTNNQSLLAILRDYFTMMWMTSMVSMPDQHLIKANSFPSE